MYAESVILFPYFQNFSQELQHFEEFCRVERGNVAMSNLVQTSTVSEYDMGGEGDLFKAPEPIIEEPLIGLDPIAAAISMISFGDDAISPQTINVAEIESLQCEQLMSEVFYECKKDLLAKSALEEQFPEASDILIPAVQMEYEPNAEKDKLFPIQRSDSSGYLSSMEWIHGSATRPNFLDFNGVDFEAAYGMRRAFSEGDIQTLGNGNMNLVHVQRPLTIGNYTIEERRRMLSRYRKKKTKRNFGRKIKYACRKALAENQPRIRGRFAKTEESDFPRSRSM